MNAVHEPSTTEYPRTEAERARLVQAAAVYLKWLLSSTPELTQVDAPETPQVVDDVPA